MSALLYCYISKVFSTNACCFFPPDQFLFLRCQLHWDERLKGRRRNVRVLIWSRDTMFRLHPAVSVVKAVAVAIAIEIFVFIFMRHVFKTRVVFLAIPGNSTINTINIQMFCSRQRFVVKPTNTNTNISNSNSGGRKSRSKFWTTFFGSVRFCSIVLYSVASQNWLLHTGEFWNIIHESHPGWRRWLWMHKNSVNIFHFPWHVICIYAVSRMEAAGVEMSLRGGWVWMSCYSRWNNYKYISASVWIANEFKSQKRATRLLTYNCCSFVRVVHTLFHLNFLFVFQWKPKALWSDGNSFTYTYVMWSKSFLSSLP